MAKKLAKRSEAGLPPWERGLNPEQLQVVRHNTGPIRVLAQAGSGKTHALVMRIVALIHAGVDPARILAVTFSNKAAGEMNERLKKQGIHDCRVGTWHSLCLQILKEEHAPEYTQREVDEKDRAKYLLKNVLGYKGMDWKGADLQALRGFIGICKANLWAAGSPEALEAARVKFGFAFQRANEAYHRLDEALEENGFLTFDDFLVFAAEYLRDESIRQNWAARWDYVLQDEYQDANGAQDFIAEALAKEHRNYMVVGDVAQSIYSFRGCSPLMLANFDQKWPDAVTVIMSRNYRSTRAVIKAANNIIRPAKVRVPSDMIGERTEEGSVRAHVAEDLEDEANGFVDWIKRLTGFTSGESRKRDDGAQAYLDMTGACSLSSITALFRTNAQSRALEEALLAARIPYVIIGGTSFYERKEVKDLLAYLRVAAGTGVADDIRRCINAPFRFLGAAFVEKVMDRACDGGEDVPEGVDWPTVITEVARSGECIQQRQRDSANTWAQMINDVHNRIEAGGDESKPAAILQQIVKQTGYIEWLRKEEGDETIENSTASNVLEMLRVADRFPTVEELLDYIDETIRAARTQRSDKQAGGERVLLMSVHRSKGLEWPHVWVAGMNELVLPHAKGDPEEERRLAYVAATRARDTLVMSYVRRIVTRVGLRDAEPSRFLHDSGLLLTGRDIDDAVERILDTSLPGAVEALSAHEGENERNCSHRSGDGFYARAP